MRRRYGVKADLPTEKRHFHVLKHSIAVHLLDIGNTIIYATLTSKTRDEKPLYEDAKAIKLAFHALRPKY